MILKYINNNSDFADHNIFSVARGVFHLVEQPGGDSIVKQISGTEAKIKQKKIEDSQKEAVNTPEGQQPQQSEQPQPPEDIVDENQVGEAVKTIEQRIAKSPVADKYKEQIKGTLSTLLGKREKEFKAIDADGEAQLKAVFDHTL